LVGVNNQKSGTFFAFVELVLRFLFLCSLGQDIQPKRDLYRFVKWPRYIRLQRQKAVLQQRLKIPPTINQFSQTLDKQTGKPQLSPPLLVQNSVTSCR
jgi:hypothetical protein